MKDTVQGLRNTAQELAGRLNEYEKIVSLARASDSLDHIHALLDRLKATQDTRGKTPDVEDSSQQASLDTSGMVVSPSSSVGSSLSPDLAKPVGQPSSSTAASGHWTAVYRMLESGASKFGNQPLRPDPTARQERSTQMVNLELFGNIPMSCSSLVTPYGGPADRHEAGKVLVPEYLIQPLWSSEQSPLSKVYVEYCEAARRLIAHGTAPAQILGPDFVSVDLFFRDRQPSDAFNVCSWACEVSKGFYMIDIKIRLALASLFTHLMRVSRLTGDGPIASRADETDSGCWTRRPSLTRVFLT